MNTICDKVYGGTILVWDSVEYIGEDGDVVCIGISGILVEDNEFKELGDEQCQWIRTAYITSLGIYNKEVYALTKNRAYKLSGEVYPDVILGTPILKAMWDDLKQIVEEKNVE